MQSTFIHRFSFDVTLSNKAEYLGIQEILNPCLTKKCKLYPNQEKGLFIPYLDLPRFVASGQIIGIPFKPKAPKKDRQDYQTKFAEYKEFTKIWEKEYSQDRILTNILGRFRFDKVSGNMPKYISNAFSDAKQFYYGGLILACLNYLEQKGLDTHKANILSYFAKIKELYLTEGELKSMVAGFCDIPIVGVGGINNIPKFSELKQFLPNLQTITMIYDKDCFDKKLLPNNEYATENDIRQINFLHSAKSIHSEAKRLGLKCLFARVKTQYKEGKVIFEIKGIDDILEANWQKRRQVCNNLLSGTNGSFFEFFTPLRFINLLDTLERNNRFKAFGNSANRDGNYLSEADIWATIKSAKKTAIISQTGVGKSFAVGQLLAKLCQEFAGRIVIVMPRRKLLKQFLCSIKPILDKEKIAFCEVYSDSNDKSELTFKTAKVVLGTPHSFHKISEHLDYEQDFFFIDEFDLIDKQGKSFDKDNLMTYCRSLEKMQNVLLSSATPNYFILKHLGIDTVYNFNVQGQENRNHFLVVKPQKGINKATQSTEIIKRELDKYPATQFLLYVNDFSEANKIQSILAEHLNLSQDEIQIAGTNDQEAKEIQEKELLTSKITIVTAWCLYGINLRNKNVVSLMLANQNHNLALPHIVQFAGRLREMSDRKVYLLLNNCEYDMDIENEFYFATINENKKVEALNDSYTALSGDILGYAKHLFINDSGQWELNKISLSLDALEKHANNCSIATMYEHLKNYGKVDYVELDKLDNIASQHEPIAPQSELIQEFCKKKQISVKELFQNSNKYADILPPSIKKSVLKVGQYANQNEIEEITDNLAVLDSTRSRGELFRDLKVRTVLRTNPSEKSVDVHLKGRFLDLVKSLFSEIQEKGHIKLSSQDLKDLEVSLQISHLLEKQKSNKSLVLSLLRAFFDTEYKVIWENRSTTKKWIISLSPNFEANLTNLESQNIYNILFQKGKENGKEDSQVAEMEKKREFLQSLELGTPYTKEFLKEKGIKKRDLENMVFDYSEKRVGSKICVVLKEVLPF